MKPVTVTLYRPQPVLILIIFIVLSCAVNVNAIIYLYLVFLTFARFSLYRNDGFSPLDIVGCTQVTPFSYLVHFIFVSVGMGILLTEMISSLQKRLE